MPRSQSRGKVGYSRLATAAATTVDDEPEVTEDEKRVRAEAAARRKALEEKKAEEDRKEAERRDALLNQRKRQLESASRFIAEERRRRIEKAEEERKRQQEAKHMEQMRKDEEAARIISERIRADVQLAQQLIHEPITHGNRVSQAIDETLTGDDYMSENDEQSKAVEIVQPSRPPRVVRISKNRSSAAEPRDFSDAFVIDDEDSSPKAAVPVAAPRAIQMRGVAVDGKSVEKPVPSHIMQLLKGNSSTTHKTGTLEKPGPPPSISPTVQPRTATWAPIEQASVPSSPPSHATAPPQHQQRLHTSIESSNNMVDHWPSEHVTTATPQPAKDAAPSNSSTALPSSNHVVSESRIPKPRHTRPVVRDDASHSPPRAPAQSYNPILSPARSFSPLLTGNKDKTSDTPTQVEAQAEDIPPRHPQPSRGVTRGRAAGLTDGASVFSAQTGRSRGSSRSKEPAPVAHAKQWGMGLHDAVNADRKLADIRRKEYELKIREDAALRRLRARSKSAQPSTTQPANVNVEAPLPSIAVSKPAMQSVQPSAAPAPVIAASSPVPPAKVTVPSPIEDDSLEDKLDQSLAKLNELLRAKRSSSRTGTGTSGRTSHMQGEVTVPVSAGVAAVGGVSTAPRAGSVANSAQSVGVTHNIHATQPPGEPHKPTRQHPATTAQERRPRYQLWGAPVLPEPASSAAVSVVARVPVGAAMPSGLAAVIARTKALAMAAASSRRSLSPDSLAPSEPSDAQEGSPTQESGDELDDLESTVRMVESLRRSRAKKQAPTDG